MPQTNRNSQLQWEELSDFRAGIYSDSGFGDYGAPLPAPKGAAQVTNTYRCIALQNGGLVPLPKGQIVSANPNLDAAASVPSGFQVSGFYAFGPVLSTTSASGFVDELHYAIEYIFNNAGTAQRRYRWIRQRLFESPNPTTSYDLVKQINSAATGIGGLAGPWQFHGTGFDATRMSVTSPNYIDVGQPVVAATWRSIGTGGEQFVSAFPNPSTPTTLSVLDLSTTISGLLVAHQGRLVIPTTANQSHGNNATASYNDPINFTDPPNSNVFPASLQNEVFAQEAPAGYGSLRSVNAGELLLVKNKGGAVLVSGDLNSPSVNRLPSVQSAGNLVSRGANFQEGFVYLAYKQGAWVWTGGNSSQKISNQLEDDFFFTANGLIATNYSCEEWGDWLMVTNNWMFDKNLRSWWRIEDPNTRQFQWWSRGFVTDAMYGAIIQFADSTNTNMGFLFQKSQTQLASNWSWQGHPLPMTHNRFVEIREVVLVAMGVGTFTITFTNYDGSTSTVNFNVNSTQPQIYRQPAAVKGYRITPRIVADNGSNTAPTLHSISFGWTESQIVAGT